MNRVLKPQFIGIGAPRCGTRWLSQCLSEHPEVALPNEEVYFFTTRRMVHSYWARGGGWYSSVLEHNINTQTKIWGEITPVYIYDDDTPALIKGYVPEVKLICCLRSQVDRAYSWYLLFLRHNPDLIYTSFSFKQFLTYNSEVFGREGFYLEHLQRYLSFFPRSALLILVYDDLVADSHAYLRQVFSFLGVDEGIRPASSNRRINSMNEIVLPRSLAMAHFADQLTMRGFYRMAGLIKHVNKMRLQGDELPPKHRVTQEVRERMFTMFSRHNERLGEFLGRDLTHWNTVRSGL